MEQKDVDNQSTQLDGISEDSFAVETEPNQIF